MAFDIIRATVLAVIQGVTEFLPISSSAHLILPGALLGWQDQGLAFDVAVHLGSLLAVVCYFRREVKGLLLGWGAHVLQGRNSADARLAWLLILATVPVVVAGLLTRDLVEDRLRSIAVIASTTVGFGLLLLYADRRGGGVRKLSDLDWKTALVVGLAQVLALVPGTSRSGITMTAALLCRLDRISASRLSFLLAIPAITGASVLLLLDLLGTEAVNWLELGYALSLCALVAFLCIHFFLKTITAIGFLPFVVYRVALGILLFLFFVPGG